MTQNQNKRNTADCVLSWAAVLLWMIFIFLLSAQPAEQSYQLSKGFTSIIVRLVGRIYLFVIAASTTEQAMDDLVNQVRDYAHAGVYFILTLLVIAAFSKSGLRRWRMVIFPFLLCAAYACLDEFHQTFVPGRGAQLQDVLVDCLGIALGLALYGVGRAFKWTIVKGTR